MDKQIPLLLLIPALLTPTLNIKAACSQPPTQLHQSHSNTKCYNRNSWHKHFSFTCHTIFHYISTFFH